MLMVGVVRSLWADYPACTRLCHSHAPPLPIQACDPLAKPPAYEDALTQRPDDPVALYCRGLAYGGKLDKKRAIADLRQAVKLVARLNELALRNEIQAELDRPLDR